METKNENQPAFASVAISDREGYQQDGLTKREYFAVAAMQGILANQELRKILSGNNGLQVPDLVAQYSLECADALLFKL